MGASHADCLRGPSNARQLPCGWITRYTVLDSMLHTPSPKAVYAKHQQS